MKYDPSIWPQNRDQGAFLVVAADAAAPFLSETGMYMSGVQELRQFIRSRIADDPRIIQFCDDATFHEWAGRFDSGARENLPTRSVDEFWRWIRETFTHGPSNRPNWEAYGDFFFEWHSRYRRGRLIADCFDHVETVADAYMNFVLSPNFHSRIENVREQPLSDWDRFAFRVGGYSITAADDSEDLLDPFTIVEATVERNLFQQFWEYMISSLKEDEIDRLWNAVRLYHDGKEWTKDLVEPRQLTRSVR